MPWSFSCELYFQGLHCRLWIVLIWINSVILSCPESEILSFKFEIFCVKKIVIYFTMVETRRSRSRTPESATGNQEVGPTEGPNTGEGSGLSPASHQQSQTVEGSNAAAVPLHPVDQGSGESSTSATPSRKRGKPRKESSGSARSDSPAPTLTN